MATTEQESLTQLLALVDQLLGHRSDDSRCRYRLGRTGTGWQFELGRDAFRWKSLGLNWQFTGDMPQEASRAFLDYVQLHGIKAADLTAAG